MPRGAVIGLCGGTTATAIADALMSRADIMEPSPEPSLTVVTNAINIAMQLAMRPQIKTVVTGGVVHARSYELVGAYADTVLGSITLDLAFIGVNGVDPVVGPTVARRTGGGRQRAHGVAGGARGARRRLSRRSTSAPSRRSGTAGCSRRSSPTTRRRPSSASASPTAATTLSLPR